MIAILASLLLTAEPAPAAPSFQLAAYRARPSILAPNPSRKPRVESSLKPSKPRSLHPKSRSKCGMTCKGAKTGKPRRVR